jgi:hypothetical protein
MGRAGRGSAVTAPTPKALLARVTGPLGQLARQGHGGAVQLLIHHWGGTKRYVAEVPPADGPLVGLIGRAAAAALAAIVSDMDIARQIDIPSPHALEAALKLAILAHPGTTREAAQALGCTERYVRMVRAAGMEAAERSARRAKPVDLRQITIFDHLAALDEVSERG